MIIWQREKDLMTNYKHPSFSKQTDSRIVVCMNETAARKWLKLYIVGIIILLDKWYKGIEVFK